MTRNGQEFCSFPPPFHLKLRQKMLRVGGSIMFPIHHAEYHHWECFHTRLLSPALTPLFTYLLKSRWCFSQAIPLQCFVFPVVISMVFENASLWLFLSFWSSAIAAKSFQATLHKCRIFHSAVLQVCCFTNLSEASGSQFWKSPNPSPGLGKDQWDSLTSMRPQSPSFPSW